MLQIKELLVIQLKNKNTHLGFTLETHEQKHLLNKWQKSQYEPLSLILLFADVMVVVL